MNDDELQKSKRLLRFFHPEKRFSFLPGALNERASALLFGMTIEDYQKERQFYRENVEIAARALLDEQNYHDALRNLTLANHSCIAAIGDSLTDDYQSWFEIFAKSISLVSPSKNIRFVNTALSGDTSAQLLGTVVKISQLKPDLLFSFIGTNDARIQGEGCKYCVELDEFERNLDSLNAYAQQHAGQVVWITPSGVDESRIQKDWLLASFQATWSNSRIHELAERILQRTKLNIDIRPAFGGENRLSLFADDGLHWSLEGQKVTARYIVEQLPKLLEGAR